MYMPRVPAGELTQFRELSSPSGLRNKGLTTTATSPTKAVGWLHMALLAVCIVYSDGFLLPAPATKPKNGGLLLQQQQQQ